VKTRGSLHDRGTFYFDIAKGGIRIEERIDQATPKRAKVDRGKSTRRRR
jgi:hypothetical protein